MARIDAQLLLSENQAVTGASANSNVIDLGSTGGFMHPLYFDVKLTTPMTSGKITKVKVQSAATEGFDSPADEVEVSVPDSLIQTRACTVAQFFLQSNMVIVILDWFTPLVRLWAARSLLI